MLNEDLLSQTIFPSPPPPVLALDIRERLMYVPEISTDIPRVLTNFRIERGKLMDFVCDRFWRCWLFVIPECHFVMSATGHNETFQTKETARLSNFVPSFRELEIRKNIVQEEERMCCIFANVNIKKACWGEFRLLLTKDSYFAYASASWFWNNSPGRVYLSLHFNIHSTACFEYLPGLRCGLKPVGNMHFLIPKYARNCDRPIIVFPAYKSEGDNLLRWGSKIRKAQEVEEILLKIRLF